MFLRSFSVQATWNYRTLMGSGFAFVLMPALQEVYGHDREKLRAAIARHTAVFNSHPYVMGVAAGAVARMEMDGADPTMIDRFKAAVRGSLGTLGDQLVWAGWRPLCALFALVLLLVGAPWWGVCGGFLLTYNAGHLAMRAYGFNVGWRFGMGVAERLRRGWIAEAQHRITTVCAFLLGVLLPLIINGRTFDLSQPAAWAGLAVIGLALGIHYGGAIRTPVVVALGAFAVLGLIA